ncbi:MAG: DUF502 domain-containing protein [Chlamydiales bacterium]|nr:DUF502 domain-containing protein [Chlamydiales bacterium]
MKKSFITGLVILLPLAVTIAIIIFIINFLTEPFMGIARSALSHFNISSGDTLLEYVSQVLIIIILFSLVVLIGFCARMFFIHALIRFSDFILLRIPFINSLYKALQEIIRTLFHSSAKSFKQVALVPFPNKDSYTLGLVTGDGLDICKKALNRDLITIYVPTTPNPTSGYLLMFKTEEVVFIDMKVEDALKYIISCGVVGKETEMPRS